MCSIKNADCQIEYQRQFGIDLFDPSRQWDAAIMQSLEVADITAKQQNLEVYSFGKNGKLLNFDLTTDEYYWTEQTSIEYYENGNMKCLRTYLSRCNDDAPFCYDLSDDRRLLDTAKAEKIPPKLNHSSHEIFWKQTLVIEGYSIEIYYQVNDKGEVFYMKWHISGGLMWAANWSMLTNAISFDSSGVISEYIKFNQVGPEWGENADTTYYMSVANINGIPRCTKKIIWEGCGYDPLYRIYECFDTDVIPGIDTGYFLYSKEEYEAKRWYCYDYDFPLAESFNYTNSGKTESRTYHYPLYDYSYDSLGSLWSHRRDSIYLLDFVRFIPNNFYEAAWVERFTLTGNWLEACNSCRFPNYSDFFICTLSHDRHALYLDENWINDPAVKCDCTYVKPAEEPLTKQEYKKWFKQEIHNTVKLLSDTTIYRVSYF